MPHFRLLLALALLALAAAVQAGPGAQHLRFEHLGAEQLGVSGVGLQCVVQDDLGQMWLGTSQGLVRYDGRRGRLFRSDAADPASLSHSWIQALAWQADGKLLVATADGLNLLDPRSELIERIALPGQRRPGERAVKQLQPALDGRFWATTHFELLLYEPQGRRFAAVPLPGLTHWPDERRPYLTGLVADGANGVWLVAGTELVHVDAAGRLRERWPLAAPPPGKPDVLSLALDLDGHAWIGGNGWL